MSTVLLKHHTMISSQKALRYLQSKRRTLRGGASSVSKFRVDNGKKYLKVEEPNSYMQRLFRGSS